VLVVLEGRGAAVDLPVALTLAGKDEHTILSGGSDGSLRNISIIQDHRSTELSQKTLKHATGGQLKRFPPVIALSYAGAECGLVIFRCLLNAA
jgi:hypothetical protein